MKKALKVRISEAALMALPVATGRELLSEYGGHVWRRYHGLPAEEEIADPAAYLKNYPHLSDQRFAVAPPDVAGVRLVYELPDDDDDGPETMFMPAFFIISREDDAKRDRDAREFLEIIDHLAAQATHVETGDDALEIALTDGSKVVFMTDANGFFSGGVVTDESAPELKKRLGAEMENLGLPLYEVAAAGLAEKQNGDE